MPTDKGEDEEQPPWLQKPLMSTDKWEDEERPPRLQKPLDGVPDVHGPGGGQERPPLGSQKPPRTSCCFQLLVVAKLLVYEMGTGTRYLVSTDEGGARTGYLMSTDKGEDKERPPRLSEATG